ncbi:DUF1307 domain-containing protein [Streptococcus zalophi]|uniref:YehR family protein n=1 Tax=Streptococcus zalophi TaxID=640031 RepID=A0A934P973_9STRE|nr:DUF1307 domain-containing protein [Streptococcus zalophi]MBJ8349339.1 YehR family protein [Streptococcus zalophi]MCR8967466.1 YehR family protein [Streptococcus zalophi]
MKAKKIILSILSLLALVVLVACGSDKKELKTTYFQRNQPGVDIRMTFHYDEDKDAIIKQETHTQMDYAGLGVETADEAKDILDSIAVQYQGINGISDKIDYGETTLNEELVIDYEKVDLKEIADIPGVFSNNLENADYISYKQTLEMLEKSGFKEVKDDKFEEFKPLN